MVLLVNLEIFLKREYQNVEQLQVFYILKEKNLSNPVKLLRNPQPAASWIHLCLFCCFLVHWLFKKKKKTKPCKLDDVVCFGV